MRRPGQPFGKFRRGVSVGVVELCLRQARCVTEVCPLETRAHEAGPLEARAAEAGPRSCEVRSASFRRERSRTKAVKFSITVQ
jgi:hypothetical protein